MPITTIYLKHMRDLQQQQQQQQKEKEQIELQMRQSLLLEQDKQIKAVSVDYFSSEDEKQLSLLLQQHQKHQQFLLQQKIFQEEIQRFQQISSLQSAIKAEVAATIHGSQFYDVSSYYFNLFYDVSSYFFFTFLKFSSAKTPLYLHYELFFPAVRYLLWILLSSYVQIWKLTMIEIDKFVNWRWFKLTNLETGDDWSWQIWKLTIIEIDKFGNWLWLKLINLETDKFGNWRWSNLTNLETDDDWNW